MRTQSRPWLLSLLTIVLLLAACSPAPTATQQRQLLPQDVPACILLDTAQSGETYYKCLPGAAGTDTPDPYPPLPSDTPSAAPSLTATETGAPSSTPTETATAVASSTPTPTLSPTPFIPPASQGNQLVGHCFEGTHGAAPDGWQQTGGWDVSRKPTNPCGPTDNRTAARINDPSQSGLSGPDRDERIWQVVPGLGAYLVAEWQCVNHFAYYTDLNIYGGASANGPWVLVWRPFTLSDCALDRWGSDIKHAERLLPQGGYAFYKVEFAAMYPPAGPVGDAGGVKFSSAYFESR